VSLFYVTGPSGAGKSAVLTELRARGGRQVDRPIIWGILLFGSMTQSVGQPERNVVLAQVSSVHTATDKLAGLVKFCQEQLPGFREMPGYKGFYLLADRESGKILTISLWDNDDAWRQHEAEGARVREEASSETGIDSPAIDLYEVVLEA
jgi:heme-degrading monooxygenase HmoA